MYSSSKKSSSVFTSSSQTLVTAQSSVGNTKVTIIQPKPINTEPKIGQSIKPLTVVNKDNNSNSKVTIQSSKVENSKENTKAKSEEKSPKTTYENTTNKSSKVSLVDNLEIENSNENTISNDNQSENSKIQQTDLEEQNNVSITTATKQETSSNIEQSEGSSAMPEDLEVSTKEKVDDTQNNDEDIDPSDILKTFNP